jgi:uncharacterized protein (DUF2267 family)
VNYNEMMRLIVGRTGLTRRKADQSFTATMTVLSEALSAKETKDLLAQLPKSLRDRVPVTVDVMPMRPIEFFARVADLTETPSLEAAETEVRAVFTTLGEAVNVGEMRDVADELGPEFADLFETETASANRSDDRELRALVGDAMTAVGALTNRLVGVACRPVVMGVRLLQSGRA